MSASLDSGSSSSSGSNAVTDALSRVAKRNPKRTEATLCHEIAALIAIANLALELDDLKEVEFESPLQDGSRRRIDIEAANCIIEVKRNLTGAVEQDAGDQLARYIQARSESSGQRHVGVLTDGREWRLLHLDRNGKLQELDRLTVSATKPEPDVWSLWLEGVFATLHDLQPTPREVSRRLGANSSGFAIDMANLRDLWEQAQHLGDGRLKRRLWSKALSTALGNSFDDDDELFITHTYLVIVAELIAHFAAGLSIARASPSEIISGEVFRKHAIHGVVEPDFFDWVTDVADGDSFVADLRRRIARFNWNDVDHDVLKVLYESVIDAETRHQLGEYYTPDWLARSIMASAVAQPIDSVVGDPACGSGTFLFHIVRLKAAAAATRGMSLQDSLHLIVTTTWGTDLHPVAVTLARVTFLLALGPELIGSRQGGTGFTVPVSLGDSLQWDQVDTATLFGASAIRISTEGAEFFERDLVFPLGALTDIAVFDRLVSELARRATTPGLSHRKLSDQFLAQHGVVDPNDRETIRSTFSTMCDLHDAGQDGIWGYYVRNLARPRWFSLPGNRAHVLVGNPPWVAFRHFTPELQDSMTLRSKALGVSPPRKYKSNAELAALFVASCIQQYLRDGGRFAFVMPRAALTGPHYEPFRTGVWPQNSPQVMVEFDEAWDLRYITPSFFPVASCVIHGARSSEPRGLSTNVVRWQGDLGADAKHICPDIADTRLSRTEGEVSRPDKPLSPYHDDFSQGSPLVPRMFFSTISGPTSDGLIPAPANQRSVSSFKSNQEEEPWKSLPSLHGFVESSFIFKVLRGENFAPFRILGFDECAIPWDRSDARLLNDEDELATAPGMWTWWEAANRLWNEYGAGKKSLAKAIDYVGALTDQAHRHQIRVIYPTSGTYLAACKVTDPEVVIAHSAYWAPVTSIDEADYLTAILNSSALLGEIAELQPVGGFNSTTRHFSRYPLFPPIPKFDGSRTAHRELRDLGAASELAAARVDADGVNFKTVRKRIRAALVEEGIDGEASRVVAELLNGG